MQEVKESECKNKVVLNVSYLPDKVNVAFLDVIKENIYNYVRVINVFFMSLSSIIKLFQYNKEYIIKITNSFFEFFNSERLFSLFVHVKTKWE